MTTHHYIAVDLGAESGRVMLATLESGRVSLEEIHRFPNGPVRLAGTLRWDVLALWEHIKEGLRIVARRGLNIASISVDSWGVDYVLMRGGEPMLRAPFCYRDARTDATFESTRSALGEKIYDITGVQFIPINTLYHLIAELKNDPELLRSSDGFLMIGDWFHYLLSGRKAQEESNASCTQLWNPKRREWSSDLIAATGLPDTIFPKVVPPCSRIGRLTPAIQHETGLGEIEVVAGCVHDTGAAVAAVPAEGNDWAYLSSGTWSLIGVELPAPLISKAGLAANFTNETGVGGTSRFLRNASGLWILQECRKAWARAGHPYDYFALTSMAAAAEPFRSIIDPNDPIFLRPDDMPEAVREFCRRTGQPIPEDAGQFARCALESLALLYRRMLALVENVTGRPIRTLHIVGGGSKNDLLNQMAADATGREVVAGPVEATSIGNVLLQGLTLGHIKSHAELRKIVRDSFPVRHFSPGDQTPWLAAEKRV
jgi:rhamnulokinase